MKTTPVIFNKINVIILMLIATSIAIYAQDKCDSFNQGMHLDGSDDRILVPSPLSGNTNYTISLDFKGGFQSDGIYPRLISFISDETEIAIKGNQLAFKVTGWIDTGLDVSDNIWHNVIAIYEHPEFRIYLDEGLVMSVMVSPLNFTSDMSIGSRYVAADAENFGGTIDNIKIWDYAINENILCDAISGNLPPNVLHYNFEDGFPNFPNPGLTGPLDLVSNNIVGNFQNISLSGSTSNYVCSYAATDAPTSCDSNNGCIVNTIDISTGVNHANSQFYDPNQQINYWSLVDMPPPSAAPNPNLSLPYIPFRIVAHPAWANFPTSGWISAFEGNQLDENNLFPLPPYSYETYFCVSEDDSDVLFDFQALADDVVTVNLTDAQGTVLHVFGQAKFKIADVLNVNESINLDAGTYCIRGDVRNTNSVAMGFNLEGTISGASFIDYGCCSGDGSIITGQKFHDKNCDGEYSSYELAMGLAGWEIELIDPNTGQVLETQFTDDLGFYYFRNLEAGNYAISEVNQPNWEQTLPGNNYYQVDLGTFDVQGGFHFGNKYEGPIETEDVNVNCVGQNGRVTLNWIGQDCDCDLEVIAISCVDAGPDVLLGTIENAGSFSISPGTLVGEYSFFIRDCDGNEIPFEGCVTFNNYEASINIQQVGCGEYDFSFLTEGFELIDIQSVDWTFDVEGTSSNNTETISFETASTYTITLDLVTNDGCQVRDRIQLEVAQGANDPDCNFCPPEVLSEIEHGDLYIYDECYGMIIKSPNGSCYRIKVSDEGLLYAQGIECP